MMVKSVMHMNAGNGGTSYASNSGLQKLVIFKTLPVLKDSLKNMLHDQEDDVNFLRKGLKMVDLGCSSGPNSLYMISQVIDTLDEFCEGKEIDILSEIEVFLNDLPHNDFNNLFKLLPNFYKENEKRRPKCFLYGLPGSFYKSLFPTKSLYFACSSYSLHWLSQIPQGLEEKNKENIYIAKSSPQEVIDAYSKQFGKDFSTFLKFRGEEMISGGRMVLTLAGRSVENPCHGDDDAYLSLFAAALVDMVTEGLVKVDDLYTFNVPLYMPCKQEVEKIIVNEGSFDLDKLLDFEIPWDATFERDHDVNDEEEDMYFDKESRGKLVSDCIRAFMEPMVATHFGLEGSILDALFQNYANKVGDHLSVHKSSYFTIVISLCKR